MYNYYRIEIGSVSMDYNNVENKNYFGVRHYNVKIVKEKIKPLKFISSVISYAIFIWLLLIGLTLLVYIADIKIRAAKGDNTPPKYIIIAKTHIPNKFFKTVALTCMLTPSSKLLYI